MSKITPELVGLLEELNDHVNDAWYELEAHEHEHKEIVPYSIGSELLNVGISADDLQVASKIVGAILIVVRGKCEDESF